MKARPAVTVAMICVLAASASAQPCYAENDDLMFNDAVSTGGPNLLIGVRFVAPANLDVTRIEVFTGEQSGPNSVAIWSHDAAGNRPAIAQATGTWQATSTNSWQGADLPSTVNLSSGTTYWMVWGPQNGAQSSIGVPQPTSVIQTYRGSFDGGATWNGPWLNPNYPWKFRLYCDSGPELNAVYTVGPTSTTAHIGLTDGPPSGTALVFFSTTSGPPVGVPGAGTIHLPLSSFFLLGAFPLDASGDFVFSVPHPTFGFAYDFVFQAIAVDPSGAATLTNHQAIGQGGVSTGPSAANASYDGESGDYEVQATGAPGTVVDVSTLIGGVESTVGTASIGATGSAPAVSGTLVPPLSFGDKLRVRLDGVLVLELDA